MRGYSAVDVVEAKPPKSSMTVYDLPKVDKEMKQMLNDSFKILLYPT
jgi:hypothetical protein